MTLIKRKNIHPIFKCSDLATHITQSTRSTQWAQTSLAEADHYSHMPTVKILRLGDERLPPPPPQKKKKKKKKSFGSLPSPQSGYATPIMVFFAHLFLLIYSSQKVPTSLKFYRALHILVLHMHRKFDVDSIDSFWDMEEQSMQSTRRKERKKERTRKLHLQANVTKKSSSCVIHLIDYKHLERADLPGWGRSLLPYFPV